MNKPEKTKKMSNTDPTKNRGDSQASAKGKQVQPLIIHPPHYSYSPNVLDITLTVPNTTNVYRSD